MKNGQEIFNQWLDYRNRNNVATTSKTPTIEKIVENINNKLNILEREIGTQKSPVDVKSGESKTITFPQFRITENFGRRSGNESDLRAFIDTIVANIEGSSWQQRVRSLENILEQTCNQACAEAKGTSGIISSLIFLDCIATVIYEFSSSTAGFIFESFMAALMGKDIIQIPPADGDLLDIEHAQDPSHGLSLKLILKSTKIEGSYDALLDYFRKYKKGVPYLIVVKGGKSGMTTPSLTFNYVEIFPSKKDVQIILNQSQIKNPLKEEAPAAIKKSTKNVSSIQEPVAGPNQYYVVPASAGKPGQIKQKKGALHFVIANTHIMPSAKQEAVLNFGDYNKLKQRSAVLVEALKGDVMGAFDNLNALMKNLTLYFADAQGGVERAKAASLNANNIIKILKQK